MFQDELATVQKCVLQFTRTKRVPQKTDRFNSVIDLSVTELYQIIQHNFSVKFTSHHHHHVPEGLGVFPVP